jgi:transcriptional regulator with XRE-family HTH domain
VTPTPYAAAGAILRQAREHAGKTMQEVAEYLLIGSSSEWEPYERGELSLSTSRITTLAHFFGLDPKVFVAQVLSAHWTGDHRTRLRGGRRQEARSSKRPIRVKEESPWSRF